MVINYDKWNNIELSDDSDVEVHPNIERNTFIRLRQRKIREEREERRLKRERAEALIVMNKDLVGRIGELRARISDADEAGMRQISAQWEQDVEVARRAKEKRDEVTKEGRLPEPPTEEEMLAALKARISDDLLKESTKQDSLEEKRKLFIAQLDSHTAKLNANLKDAEHELEEIRREEAMHISPDSITHAGFDRSFVSKPGSSSASGSKSKPETRTVKQTVTTEEVLNPGCVGKFDSKAEDAAADVEDNDDIDEDGSLRLDADSKAFASLTNMSDSFDYITKHLSIVSEAKADQILGHAFTLQLDGKTKLARQYVHQSLILTYILTMGSGGVRVFFDRVASKGSRAQEMFSNDVESRYKHIVERCKVIKSERENESDEPEVESIQLQCDDPDAPIRISVPDENNAEEDTGRIELFKELPLDFQNALKEGTLDAVNKVLATIPGPEAERLLGICGQGSFLVIDGEIIVDPNEQKD